VGARRGAGGGAPRVRERGDYERGLAEADIVVSGEYTTAVVLHNSMETHQAVVQWVGGGVDVHISTQFIWGIRAAVAAGLELPPDKVRVICHYMGGGFGSKNGPDDYTFIAAELARRTGRPVKCALTRREESVATGNRNATIQRLTVGARSDGTLTELGGDFVNPVGWSGWSSGTEGPMQMLYACPNVRTTTYPARINQPPMKAFRAPGFVEGTFGLEALLDELAAKLELDSFALRRKNYADQDEADGRPYSSKQLLECYRRAEPHWERRHEVRARSTDTVKRGVGMASQIWYGGGGPPSYAWIRVGSDGHATVVTAMQDIGTGTKTAMAQIAAEELGIPLDRVTVSLGDSARGAYAAISAGSSTTPSMGPAVRAAAADAKRQIVDIATQRGDPDLPLEEVVALLEDSQILGSGARGPNPAGMQVLTFGVQVAEVAVDVETGEIWVERIAAIHDVGRVINPLGASSQVEGGIIQGIGHTLSEERLHDPRTGRILTTGLDAYKLPTIADVPEIISELVDKPDEHLTNLGSKGLGEPPIIPVAAAIANAIRDATGADVRRVPITREEMLRALREAAARRTEKEKVGAPAGR
jgi:CO/xanthine dehydrogenase Mo-binding subunit